MKCWTGVLLMAVFFTGCEKDINLNINNQQPLLVVDGYIENGKAPVIVLSSSLNYFSSISPAELTAAFVHNAVVTISDGSKTIRLNEYSQRDSAGYSLYYYTAAESNHDSILRGALNRQYKLSVTTAEGKNYTSSTTIPAIAKTVDSLWWKTAPDNPDTTRCVLFGRFTDPKGLGNYIRYFTQVNDQPFLSGLNSVFDDQFTDGTTYDLSFDVGYDRNAIVQNRDDYGFAHRGDRITLKFCNIDKATFDFWRTWEFSYQSLNNPFSSPVKVIGNISNGALGAFSGYAAEYKTLVIPK